MEHLLRSADLHTLSVASDHAAKQQQGQDFTWATQMSKTSLYSILLPPLRRNSYLRKNRLHWE